MELDDKLCRSMPEHQAERTRLRFGPRNYACLAGAVVALGLGYFLLAQGSTTVAPILLVLGYCVLFPVGLAL
jgi:hypothetical protein